MPVLLQNRNNSRLHGDYASLFHGLGVEFETVRPYVVGDDVRYIDWRVTARSGTAHVKTFRAECDRNVLVVVDANAYMRFGTRGTFKSVQAAKAAALLCWKSLQQQDRVGGLVFGDIVNGIQYFRSAKSDSSVLRMLKLLCEQSTNLHAQVPVSFALQHASRVVTPQSLVFVISDFACENIVALEQPLLELRKKCTLVLLPVFDPADKDIPAVGPLSFTAHGQTIMINTNDIYARQNYHNAWLEYSAQLNKLSKKTKTPLVWIETMTDPLKSLFYIAG